MSLATETTAPEAPPARRARVRLRLPPWLGAVVVTAALVALAGYQNPKFVTAENLLNIAGQQATCGIVAVGMVLVITAGGIDLSVGSLVALAGGLGILVVQFLLNHGWSGLLATIVGAITMLAAGLLAGMLNGVLIAKGRLPAFIATLAALLAFRSAAGWIANGGQYVPDPKPAAFLTVSQGWPIPNTDISRPPPDRQVVAEHVAEAPVPQTRSRRKRNVAVAPTTAAAEASTPAPTSTPTAMAASVPHEPLPLRLPYEVVTWFVVVVIGMVVLNRTRLGRYAIAVGSNARAARYSAVPVARVRIWVYALSGLLAGVAAFMEASRNEATINSGSSGLYLELFAIAAAVIGGTRMTGGVGSVFGSAVGAFLLGVILNVIISLQTIPLGHLGTLTINEQAKGVVTGAIIVLAALAQRGEARE